MRKAFYILLFLLPFTICGCSVPDFAVRENNDVETLKNWSFQFNEETDDYSLFFGLLDEDDKYISADVNVDILIVNENDEEVYKRTKSISQKDFDYYTSQAAGEQYLAELRIPATDIATGKSSNGTVYLTVYKDDNISFDEVSCSALYCLPVSDVNLIYDALPLTIDVKGYDGNIESTIQINDISYSYKKDYVPQLDITISGTKIYGKTNSLSSYDMISYRLYDSEGYMVTSNGIYLDSLNQDDKFKDSSIEIYDIIPGETYTLVLRGYDW